MVGFSSHAPLLHMRRAVPMILYVEMSDRNSHRHLIEQYFRLRKRVFCDELKWVDPVSEDMEYDDFDFMYNIYILHVDDCTGEVTGGVRLMPTTGPTLMHTVWADMLPDRDDFRSPAIWEATRFCADALASSRKSNLANRITLALTLAVIDFRPGQRNLAHHCGLREQVLRHDQRLLRRSGRHQQAHRRTRNRHLLRVVVGGTRPIPHRLGETVHRRRGAACGQTGRVTRFRGWRSSSAYRASRSCAPARRAFRSRTAGSGPGGSAPVS